MLTIIFICDACSSENASKNGLPGFESKTFEFYSFSEAWLHVRDNPTHYVDTIIRDDRDDE